MNEMTQEKIAKVRRFMVIQRCVSLTLLLINIFLPIILISDYSYFLWLFLEFPLVWFVGALMLSCKEYVYKGNYIVVYAGFYNHYILVNGEKYDEHKALLSWVPIYLDCVLENGGDVNVTISTSNRIALKINGRLCEAKK